MCRAFAWILRRGENDYRRPSIPIHRRSSFLFDVIFIRDRFVDKRRGNGCWCPVVLPPIETPLIPHRNRSYSGVTFFFCHLARRIRSGTYSEQTRNKTKTVFGFITFVVNPVRFIRFVDNARHCVLSADAFFGVGDGRRSGNTSRTRSSVFAYPGNFGGGRNVRRKTRTIVALRAIL